MGECIKISPVLPIVAFAGLYSGADDTVSDAALSILLSSIEFAEVVTFVLEFLFTNSPQPPRIKMTAAKTPLRIGRKHLFFMHNPPFQKYYNTAFCQLVVTILS